VGAEVVPDLSSADHVLFVGESGGAGGIIHNAEWITNRIADVRPGIKVSFAAASRMLPWIEAETHFSAAGGGIWDDRFSGVSTVEKNLIASGFDATITYSEDALDIGGDTRKLLDSWGDINSATALFLDGDCKTEHFDLAHKQWKCYDEGHVVLYHMDENVFFFESLLDGTHAGEGSPVLWMDEADGVPLDPGFVWNPPGTQNFTQARINRVLYTIDQILQNSNHRGMRGFYAPAVNLHTMVKQSFFYTNELLKNNMHYSFGNFLYAWQIANDNYYRLDFAAVEDGGAPAAYQLTWSSPVPGAADFGGGWIH
jgi:hypothetical protein